MRKLFLVILLVNVSLSLLIAQEGKYGKLTGSLESFFQAYRKKDDKIGFVAPDDRLRSNNYLKLDYTYKKFSAGVQAESYEKNAMLGYPEIFKGTGVTNYYVGYTSNKWQITLGHFYEQFGNGAVLRSWEDRQIGINNALFGARLLVKPANWITLKLIGGRKRNGFSSGDAMLYGTDVEMNIYKSSNPKKQSSLQGGLSYVYKQEEYTGALTNVPTGLHLMSTRLQYNTKNLTLETEIALRTNDALINDRSEIVSTNKSFTGNLIQLNATITGKQSGCNIVLRQLQNFGLKTDRLAPLNQLLLNYVPALTKQHHYSLANIYVYNPQIRFGFLPGQILQTAGEMGGKIDWYKNFAKQTKWGGKYGMQLNVSFAQYNGIAFSTTDVNTAKVSNFKPNDINFRDFHFEIKKNWSKKFKTSVTYINLLYNQQIVEGFGSKDLAANIVIADGTYKFKNGHSLKTDLQHMWVKNGKGNWAASTIEYATGSLLSFFVVDLYHYQNPTGEVHYYNGGFALTNKTLRIMASYGRQREGLICVGGVCRLVPASAGFNLTTSWSF